MSEFVGVVTTIGQGKIAASIGGTALNLTTVRVGDGNGAAITPAPGMTDLVRRVGTAYPIISSGRDPLDATKWVVTTLIPEAAGPFDIREIGVFDSTGDMIAIAKHPWVEKRTPAQGLAMDLTIDVIFPVSETAQVTVTISPAVQVSLFQQLRAGFLVVESATVTAPPASPALGRTHVVPAGATGAWSGLSGFLVQWDGSSWVSVDAPIGFHVVDQSKGLDTGTRWLERTAGGWVPGLSRLLQKRPGNFIAAAGSANALAVTLDPAPANYAALAGTELDIVVATTNTGPATINANALGAIPILRNDLGAVAKGDLIATTIFKGVFGGGGAHLQLLAPVLSQLRPRLTTDLTLYIRSDGNDNNSGLVNSAGGAFLTLQRAANVALTYDCAGFSIFVSVSAGSYSGAGAILSGPLVGSNGPLRFVGNPANPASVVVRNTASAGNLACFTATGGGQISVDGFDVGSANGNALYAQGSGSVVSYGNMQFAACAAFHTEAYGGGQIVISAGTNYNLSGNAQSHFRASQGGTIVNNAGARSVGISGGVAVNDFASCDLVSSMNVPSLNFGTITGRRYLVQRGAWISTAGGGVNYFPGTVAGVGANYD